MADVTIAAPAVQATPAHYTVPGAQEIIVKCVSASFDGSGAGAAYVPTLQIVAPGGQIAGSFPIGSSVAAGASADVSWFPNVGGGAGGFSNGIQFDTDNEGGYLDIFTNDDDSPPFAPGSGVGFRLQDTSGGGMRFNNAANGPFVIANDFDDVFTLAGGSGLVSIDILTGQVDADGFGWYLSDSSGGGTMNEVFSGNAVFRLRGPGAGNFEIRDSSGNAILRVTESGTYHIKTGAAWVADL